MSRQGARAAPLDGLRPCPVVVTNHSRDAERGLARAALADIPPVDVARTPGGLYVVDGHLRVAELRRRGAREAPANEHAAADEAAVVALHARLHQCSPVDPLRLIDAGDFLVARGASPASLPRLLCLDPVQRYVLARGIEPGARRLLDGHLAALTRRFSRASYPPHVVAMICKAPRASQRRAAENLIRYMDVACSRSRFSFPSAGQMEVLIGEAGRPEPPPQPPFEVEEGPRAAPARRAPPEVPPGADRLICAPHEALLSCGCGATYRVNMRRHTMSRVTARADSVTVAGDAGSPLIAIPPGPAGRLGAGPGDDVYFRAGTRAELARLLSAGGARRAPALVCSTERI